MTVPDHLPEERLPEDSSPSDQTTAPVEAAPSEECAPAETATAPERTPLTERSAVLFAGFLLIAAIALAGTLRTVHDRQPDEFLQKAGSVRSHAVLSNWLNHGYFHYLGMINRDPRTETVYLNSTGGYMVSGFIVEKIYSSVRGHYSYRLLALHNQVVNMVISALAGLLSYRLARRFGLGRRLAFTAASAVVIVLFTFPDNLDLYWEMSAQAYGLLFALLYAVLEERSIDLPSRPRHLLLAQAASVFLMTVMESVFAMGVVASIAAVTLILRRDGSWKRVAVFVAAPCVAALVLYQLQLKAVALRFPDLPTTGSRLIWRTGFDGDSAYYGDHLDIAKRRDVARINWPKNREHLFRWKWVFILGVVSTLAVLVAFVRGHAPRIALEVLICLTGGWLLYAAIFSQAFVIHPYLYDVLLFTPLCIALFAIGPSLLESLTRYTGAIVLVIFFSAVWYSTFQMRLYSLRWPLPPTVTSPVENG